MSEQEPRQSFESLRNQALYRMVASGWGSATSGDVHSPQGLFARISNEVAERDSLNDAFGDTFDELGITAAAITGHWLVRVNLEGELRVTEYPNEDELVRTYRALDEDFLIWLTQQGAQP